MDAVPTVFSLALGIEEFRIADALRQAGIALLPVEFFVNEAVAIVVYSVAFLLDRTIVSKYFIIIAYPCELTTKLDTSGRNFAVFADPQGLAIGPLFTDLATFNVATF